MIRFAVRGGAQSLVLAVLIALPSSGHAETIYKWRGNDGTVTYSQSAPADADPGRVEKIDVETLSPAQHRAALRWLWAEEHKADAGVRKLEAAWNHADAQVKSALGELRKGEAALAAGRAPRPGERLGTVGGGSRLTQAYFDRLHALEMRVEREKQRLDLSYQQRDSLK